MRVIYAILILFFSAPFICSALDSTSVAKDTAFRARQLIKYSLLDITTQRLQFERAPVNHISYGIGASYSPKGYYGNSPGSKWLSLSPMFRRYPKNDKAKGFYMEASLPIEYFYNYQVWYSSVAEHSDMFFSSADAKWHKDVRHTFFTAGGGISAGAQFCIDRWFFVDLGFGYEKFYIPGSIKSSIWQPIYDNSTTQEEYTLDARWVSYFTGRIYFGFKLFKD